MLIANICNYHFVGCCKRLNDLAYAKKQEIYNYKSQFGIAFFTRAFNPVYLFACKQHIGEMHCISGLFDLIQPHRNTQFAEIISHTILTVSIIMHTWNYLNIVSPDIINILVGCMHFSLFFVQ